MAAGSGRLKKRDRLLQSKDYRRLSRRGYRHKTEHFVLLVSRVGDAHSASQPRLGITVSRKVGNAIVRNRLKRQIREWFRTTHQEIAEPMDLVVIAMRGGSGIGSASLNQELAEGVRSLEIRRSCGNR